MSEDRDKLMENDEPGTEQEDVEAHRLKAPHANDEGGTDGDDDVEGHVLKRQG